MVFGFPFRQGARTVGYECRVALGMAMIGNGANDTPVPSQAGRDKTVAANEGSRQRTCRGCHATPQSLQLCGESRHPWSWYAASRLMTSHDNPGCRGQIGLFENNGQTAGRVCETRNRLDFFGLHSVLLFDLYIGGGLPAKFSRGVKTQ